MPSRNDQSLSLGLIQQAIADVGVRDVKAERINRNISTSDAMYDPHHPDQYAVCGASALQSIRACQGLSSAPDPGRILDFGCGSGRVMRWLAAAYPSARITGTDIGQSDVDFCAEQFGATPVLSGTDFARLPAFSDFDLIWAGSVVTHLRESDAVALIHAFVRWLRPGGVAVFSSHGRQMITNMATGAIDYLPGASPASIYHSLGVVGYGYAAYVDTPSYGISVATPGWFASHIARLTIPCRMVCYSEQAWVHHHDIVALQRVT